MNGGIEQMGPNGPYCGFAYAVVKTAEGTVNCDGEGTLACEYHDNNPERLTNILIGHAATNKLNGNLSGTYNLNIIDNGIMYYGFVNWSTNIITDETVANVTVNP